MKRYLFNESALLGNDSWHLIKAMVDISNELAELNTTLREIKERLGR